MFIDLQLPAIRDGHRGKIVVSDLCVECDLFPIHIDRVIFGVDLMR